MSFINLAYYDFPIQSVNFTTNTFMENQEAKELPEQKKKLDKDKRILEAKENQYINEQISKQRKNNNRLRMLIGKALMKYINEGDDNEKLSRKEVLASILNRYTAYEPDRTFLIEQGYLDL